MKDAAYNLRWVDRASEIDRDLWETCFRPPAEGFWWYDTLERSGLEDQFRFFYGVFEEDDQDVGIAPAFLFDMPLEEVAPKALLRPLRAAGKLMPSILHQRTIFVGSPCVDEGTIGLLPWVNRRSALAVLHNALHQKAKQTRASMVVWKDFPARVAHDFDWLAEQARLFRAVSFPGTIAYLPTRDKADFFTSLKGSRRHNLKKKIRKSVEKASLAAETVRAPDATTLDRIFDLFTQTYQKSDQKFEKLTRKFFDVISEQASVFYLLLRERSSRDIVAFMLCFDMKPILVNKFIGLDYSRPRDWNLYFRLWDATLDLAAEHGYSAIESGQLAYPVKIEMGHRLQALNNYCFHRNPFMHRIYALATRATVSWYTLDDGLSRHLKAHPETLHELQNTGRASEVRWVAEPQPDEQPVTTQSVYY